MPWYRRMAWSFYHRILVLGTGRFQAAVSFLAWIDVFVSHKKCGPGDAATRFDRFAEHVCAGLKGIVSDFAGLRLHNRVAFIVPHKAFAVRPGTPFLAHR